VWKPVLTDHHKTFPECLQYVCVDAQIFLCMTNCEGLVQAIDSSSRCDVATCKRMAMAASLMWRHVMPADVICSHGNSSSSSSSQCCQSHLCIAHQRRGSILGARAASYGAVVIAMRQLRYVMLRPRRLAFTENTTVTDAQTHGAEFLNRKQMNFWKLDDQTNETIKLFQCSQTRVWLYGRNCVLLHTACVCRTISVQKYKHHIAIRS